MASKTSFCIITKAMYTMALSLVRQDLIFCNLLPYAKAFHKDFSPKETIANIVIMVL